MKRILSLLLMGAILFSTCMLSVPSVLATETEETEEIAEVTETAEVAEPEEAVVAEKMPAEKNVSTEGGSEGSEPQDTEAEDDGSMKASDELIELLKYEEGFCKYPVWDYSQYTVGYGTRCPNDMLSEYMSRGITEHEAELLLREHLVNTEYLINTKLIEKYGITLTQGQFDALVTFSYNMGPGWITSPSQNIHQQVVKGATGNDIIDALSRWCKAGGSVNNVLLRRRLSEARMYIEGIYSHSIPTDTYCYVLYNGNGGSVTQSAQGYNPNLSGATPRCVATYGSYTFAGWYTSASGGEKVEVLTQALRGKTLYAHWVEVEPEEPDVLENPVTVKVTTNNVNLRKGPGTNYATIGSAKKGDTYTITQILETTSYTWGYYGSGWICLQYTNYGNTDEPETEAPEVTEPETTEPEATQPEETEPEEDPVTGKINANPYLCVRKGPGTGYAVVDTLQNGEKVTILQQKAEGSSVWGRVSNGWISMNYVILDKEETPEVNMGGAAVAGQKTGTVTCEVLNVRSGAGIGYNVVASYKKNDTVAVTDEKTVGSTVWGKTSKGWVSMDYVKLQSSEGNSGSSQGSANGGGSSQGDINQGGSETTQLTGTVTSSDVLRIRSGAGTSYGIVGYLNPGAKVTITDKKTVGNTPWGKVSKGWISMDYVKLDSNSTEDPANRQEGSTASSTEKTVTATCLCVRENAGTNYKVVDYLYKGSKVKVTETKDVDGASWGKIANGWICLDYTK